MKLSDLEKVTLGSDYIILEDHKTGNTIYTGKWDDIEENFVEENFERRINAIWARSETAITDWEPSLIVIIE